MCTTLLHCGWALKTLETKAARCRSDQGEMQPGSNLSAAFFFYFCQLVRHLSAWAGKKIQYIIWLRNAANNYQQIISTINVQRWHWNPDRHQWKAVGCAHQPFPLKASSSGCLAVKHRGCPELSTALRESLHPLGLRVDYPHCSVYASPSTTLSSVPSVTLLPSTPANGTTATTPRPEVQPCRSVSPSLVPMRSFSTFSFVCGKRRQNYEAFTTSKNQSQ